VSGILDRVRRRSPEGGIQPRDLSVERERAATIAYTSLWQLRELDPANEPEELRRARLLLRNRLSPSRDGNDGAPHPAPRSHPGRGAALHLEAPRAVRSAS